MRFTALQPPPPTPITLILATLLGTILLLLISSLGIWELLLLPLKGIPILLPKELFPKAEDKSERL